MDDFMLKYQIDAFPTMLILNSAGELVKKITGYSEAPELLIKLKGVIKPIIAIYF